jgi:hypothetical protein
VAGSEARDSRVSPFQGSGKDWPNQTRGDAPGLACLAPLGLGALARRQAMVACPPNHGRAEDGVAMPPVVRHPPYDPGTGLKAGR